MLRKVVAKELREIVRDRRLCAAVGAVPVLLIAILAMNWYERRRLVESQHAAEHAARENWLNQGNRDPHGAAHHGTFLFKPKLPLSFFDPGLDPYLGTTIRLEAHRQHRLANRPAADGVDPLRFDAATAALTLQVVLPLIAILLGFSAISGERERGTLPLLLSLGVPCGRLLLGKAITILSVAAFLVSPVALFFGGALAGTGHEASLTDTAMREALIVFAYAMYLGGWVSLTLGVSARAGSSRMALIVLVAIWATSVLIVPRLASETARRVYPLPTQEDIERQTKQAMRTADGKSRAAERSRQLETQLLAQYGVSRKEDLPMNFDGVALQAAEELTDQIHDEVDASLEAILARQDRLVEGAALVSPFLAIRTASMSLAGTDRSHHDRFSRTAEEHRRTLVRTMNEALARRKRGSDLQTPTGRELWESVEEFRYRAPSWHWSARAVVPQLALLGAWFAVTAGLALSAKPGFRGAD